MNREQRRNQKRKNRKNSKKNFQYVGTMEIPAKMITQDNNLKECDKEILDLCMNECMWRDKKMVKHDVSKCIIMTGISYLDALTALRFDITPMDDKILVRNAMWHVSNIVNHFIGMYVSKEDTSISDKLQEAGFANKNSAEIPYPVEAEMYPMYPMPEEEAIDDLYAGFVVKHACEVVTYIMYANPLDVVKDEKYVFEVLNMIVKKTKELLPEATVKSKKFVIDM